MTDPWTTPTSWVNGTVPGATEFNEQIRDNMGHLKSPPLSNIVTAYTGATLPSTTASTAIPITAGLSATLTTYGAPVQVYFNMRVSSNGPAPFAVFNLKIDGTAYMSYAGGFPFNAPQDVLAYHVWVTGLASGAHVFVPTWQVSNPTGTAIANASSHPVIFWVREG